MAGGRTLRAAGPAWSRRSLLRAGAVGAAVPAVLAACGTPPAATSASSSRPPVPDLSDSDKRLVFSNWQLYIDVDDDDPQKRPTLDEFTRRTGIEVDYVEDIVDTEAFYAKVAPQLKAGQPIDRDIVVPTEEVAARMIRQGLVQPFDRANTPNVTAQLLPSLRDPAWDPGRARSTPWQTGLTGIAYHAGRTGEVRTIAELLTRPDLKGRVALLTEWRDSAGLVMLEQGADPESFTDDQYDAAVAAVQQAVDAGQVRRFTGNDYTAGLANGTVHACLAWSGDIVQMQADDPQIRFVEPEAGMMIWADAMLIPQGAAHKRNAEKLTDYYYEPDVAARLAAWVQYISPVSGARTAMEKVDPELVDNPLVFPDEEFLARTHTFMDVDAEQEKRYAQAWTSLMGG